MEAKQSPHITIRRVARICIFALLPVLLGCGDQDVLENNLQLSDREIELGVDGWRPMTESRATIFEDEDDFLNDDETGKGGGNFTMHAYLRETGATYIGGSRAWYFVPDGETEGNWRFYDQVNNRFIQYYWPQNNTVDFFAYMPWKGGNRQKTIEVGNYVSGTGLTVNCEMPNEVSLEDEVGQETIIAYTTNKSKADKKVNMHFVHPFSAVYFKLKQAHRNLTINWIRFNDVYLTGSTTLNATTDNNTQISWTGTDATSTFTIPVEKTIPDDINFGAKIGGPYLVMPQSFGKGTDSTDDDITITINYTWVNAKAKDDEITGDEDYNSLDPDDEKNKNNIYQITRPLSGNWLAGNKYTYVLNLGDNEAEILFKVLVEPWDVTGDDNNIFDVE